jgi:hypothetical protein
VVGHVYSSIFILLTDDKNAGPFFCWRLNIETLSLSLFLLTLDRSTYGSLAKNPYLYFIIISEKKIICHINHHLKRGTKK